MCASHVSKKYSRVQVTSTLSRVLLDRNQSSKIPFKEQPMIEKLAEVEAISDILSHGIKYMYWLYYIY